jgi:hypothetical protein
MMNQSIHHQHYGYNIVEGGLPGERVSPFHREAQGTENGQRLESRQKQCFAQFRLFYSSRASLIPHSQLTLTTHPMLLYASAVVVRM